MSERETRWVKPFEAFDPKRLINPLTALHNIQAIPNPQKDKVIKKIKECNPYLGKGDYVCMWKGANEMIYKTKFNTNDL